MGNPCHFSGFQNLSHVKKFQEENNKQTGVRTGTCCGNPLAHLLRQSSFDIRPISFKAKMNWEIRNFWSLKATDMGLWGQK